MKHVEEFSEQLSRVERMAQDSAHHTPLEQAALQSVIGSLKDAATLIVRLARALEGVPRREQLRTLATDWVKRKGLQGSILR